jgi:hypothetical protein
MTARMRLWIVVMACATIGLSAVGCGVLLQGTGEPEGTLRILVTDKPYPLDLIEETSITITRVDVLRAGGLPVCTSDADCADDVYCNGTETCVGGECVNGTFPCGDGEFCDEELAACLSPCTTDEQCNDSFFCNGIETCDLVTGQCLEGVNPCADGEVCDESGDACLPADNGTPDDGDEDDAAWVTVFEGEKPFNLLELQGQRTEILADTEIGAGTYTQMRLVVTEGRIKLYDVAEPFVLKVPSGERSGIKLHFAFEISGGEETTLLLDVDLSRAFRPIPSGHIDDPATIRTFHFTPSVAMRLIDLLDAGATTGIVTDDAGAALEDVVVTAFDQDGSEVTSSGTNVDGEFVLGGLRTGDYRLELSLAGYGDAEVPSVSVTAGETTDVGQLVMTATKP